MLSLFALTSCAMRFGTFASHVTPPIAQIPIVKPLSDIMLCPSSASNDTLIGYVGRIVPTLSTCCTLVCWDDDDLHYFRYTTGNALKRCIWGAPEMSLSRKVAVFVHMRRWYVEQANANLTLTLYNEEDTLSWTISTLLLAESK
jgi:hypothetical protein